MITYLKIQNHVANDEFKDLKNLDTNKSENIR